MEFKPNLNPKLPEKTPKKETFIIKEKFESLYKIGKQGILAATIALSVPMEHNKTNEQKAFSEYTEVMENNHISKETQGKIYTDLCKIFNRKLNQKDKEMIKDFMKESKGTEASDFLLDDASREVLIKLSKIYKIEGDDLFLLAITLDKETVEELKDNQNFFNKITEIRQSYPDNISPKLSGIPLIRLLLLDSDKNELDLDENSRSKYFDGLKMLASAGIKDLAVADVNLVIKINEDNSKFETIKDAMKNKVKFNEYFLVLEEENLNNVDEFLSNNKNAKLLTMFSKEDILNSSAFSTLYYDKAGSFINFFEDEQNKEVLNTFNALDYDVNDQIKFINEYNKDILQKPEFLELLKLAKESGAEHYIFNEMQDMFNIRDHENLLELIELLKIENNKKIKDIDPEQKIKNVHDSIFNEQIFNQMKTEAKANQDFNADAFRKDPALDIIYALKYNKKVPKYLECMDRHQQVEWLLRVARNMNISAMLPGGVEISEREFEKVFNETFALRMDKELLNTSLFKNRNVVLVADNEKSSEGDRFGKEKTIDMLGQQNPDDLTVLKSDSSSSSALETKKSLLQYIENNPKITMVIDAHGLETSFSITSDKNVTSNNSMSFNEIVSSLKNRYKKGFFDTPILISSACYNQDFIRNLSENILNINRSENLDIPIPILIGESEFGQYAFSDFSSEYGAKFFELLAEKGKNIKISDILQIESANGANGMLSNISVFAPLNKKFIEHKFNKKSGKFDKKNMNKKLYYQIANMDITPIEHVLATKYLSDVKNNRNPESIAHFESDHAEIAQRIQIMMS